MNEGDIDISGLDKAEVLAALFNASKPQGTGFFQSSPASLTISEARAALEACSGYVDYLRGRVIKVGFMRDSISPRLYDRDLGQGAAARVIAKLRQKPASQQTVTAKGN